MTTNSSTTVWYRQYAVLYTAIAVLIIASAYLLFRNWQLNNEFEQERTNLRTAVQQNQLANDRQQLTFGLKAFVWAVRNALLQNKAGEVNEYFNTLVKDRGVREVLLVDTAGKITISTNKKNQGTTFEGRFPAYLLQQQGVYFNPKKPYELSAPITAPNQRMGTLVMFYNPAPILPDSLSAN
ncbi:hypothetical protein [Spirosoma sp. KUDC1026]|uniref:hypothetical protein n=1 Tax=Spirosoma sp. KUDC1026 TaxID=2745947 RepID=UPI00159BC472|nr:hypothetical protein [Spirosoma sp. KUDC1026]QKZ11312.1 hypothetical protein HU175_01130 [Spirosoma sp. KUDC1026]